MEVGAYRNGFCDSLATDITRARDGVGDSGPAYEVDTFSGCANDLHYGGILQVVHMRDCPVTWSTSIYSIESGS